MRTTEFVAKQGRTRLLFGAAVVALTVTMSFCGTAMARVGTQTCGAAAASGSNSVVTCGLVGVPETWTVPAGVTSVTLDVKGAQGGAASGVSGGQGGEESGTLSVTAGEVLTVMVGSQGGSPNGSTGAAPAYGGGGAGGTTTASGNFGGAGGGGGSFVFDGTGDLVIAAGGGGGSGNSACSTYPYAGGGGGGATGDSLGPSCPYEGGGGTQSGGGAGGSILVNAGGVVGGNGGGPATWNSGNPTAGNGGAGGGASSSGIGGMGTEGGGGGGGGYYGGGGGATQRCGGGGSGYASSLLSSTSSQNDVNPGNGVVTITYATPVAPAITSAGSASFDAGQAGSFTVAASGSPTASLSESGALPAGVKFVSNGDGTATLSGTPAFGSGGSYSVTITASNGVSPDTTQTFVLTVVDPVVTVVDPVVSGLTVVPRVFSVAGRRVGHRCVRATKANRGHKSCVRHVRLVVRYRLNIAAKVTFRVEKRVRGRVVNGLCVRQTKTNRHDKACIRVLRVRGKLTRSGHAGANSFRWAGKIGGHVLRPGRYVLVATPEGGKSRKVRFTIKA